MSDPALSVTPEYGQLIEFLDTLVKWQKFGTFLPGIKSEDIQVIELEESKVDQQKAALFTKWLHVHTNPLWQDVICALKKAQEHALASQIYQKLNTSSSPAASSISQGIVAYFLCLLILSIIPFSSSRTSKNGNVGE